MVPAPMLVLIADVGIAQVGQVIGFRARAQARILELDEVADARIFADAVSLPQARERSDDGARFDVRIRDACKRGYFNVGRERRVFDDGASADAAILADFGASQNLREGPDDGILADPYRTNRW